MRSPHWVVKALAASAALAATAVLGATGALPVRAAVNAAKCTKGPQPPKVGASSILYGVAVVSVCDAWTVGTRNVTVGGQDRQRTLIEHWNGTDWIPVASPNPGKPSDNDYLFRVTALSSTNIWAVGTIVIGTLQDSLIEHFNGKKWQVVASQNPGGKFGTTELNAIWAASPSDIWAAGSAWFGFSGGIVEHWNGHKWSATVIPNPQGTTVGTLLNGISGSSGSDVFAVGSYCHSPGVCSPVILHWNGQRWKWSTGPVLPAVGNGMLTLVSMQSKDDAWAVGSVQAKSGKWVIPLVEHWNGRTWRRASIPNLPLNTLGSVASFSADSAVAVGTDESGAKLALLILTWNGRKWTRLPSPHPFGPALNYGVSTVAGSSCSNAWIVGDAWTVANFQLPLAVRC